MSNTRMKKEWKDKWIAALRSGEYTQGEGGLCSTDGSFCCLGVLCDLVVKENPEIKWEAHSNKDFQGYRVINNVPDFVPGVVMDITGLDSLDPEIVIHSTDDEDDDDELSLSEVNDRLMKSFTEIADLIEEQIEGVE